VTPSRSAQLSIRGLRHHVREWGSAAAPKLFLLHGWMDVSASFQFTVDELERDWFVIAPDWRGFGLSEWSDQGYWFPDYLSDLDHLLNHYAADQPARIAGHSMGGIIAGLYAGVRPERVRRLVLAEGFGLPPTNPDQAPERYGRWLAQNRDPPRLKPYRTFDQVAQRLRANNPRLTEERARYLAQHWAAERPDGSIHLRADPRHKMVNPILYRAEEAMACWRRIAAPVLWLWGDESGLAKLAGVDGGELDGYRACYASLAEKTITAAGHMMHLDQPAAFAQAIEDFMGNDDQDLPLVSAG
jgi:pimeloyl-ACP methyl ester carboxylesterase